MAKNLGIVPSNLARQLAVENHWFVRSVAGGGFEPCEPGDAGCMADLNRAADSYWYDARTKQAAPVTAEQRAIRENA